MPWTCTGHGQQGRGQRSRPSPPGAVHCAGRGCSVPPGVGRTSGHPPGESSSWPGGSWLGDDSSRPGAGRPWGTGATGEDGPRTPPGAGSLSEPEAGPPDAPGAQGPRRGRMTLFPWPPSPLSEASGLPGGGRCVLGMEPPRSPAQHGARRGHRRGQATLGVRAEPLPGPSSSVDPLCRAVHSLTEPPSMAPHSAGKEGPAQRRCTVHGRDVPQQLSAPRSGHRPRLLPSGSG